MHPFALSALSIALLMAAPTAVAGSELLPPPDIVIDQTRSDPNRSTRPFSVKHEGALWDTHVHLDPPREEGSDRKGPEELLLALDKAGVTRINIMPTPNEGRFDPSAYSPKGGINARESLRNKATGRVRVNCGAASLTVWMHEAAQKSYREEAFQSRFGSLVEAINVGRCAGIGEIGLFHFQKWGHQAVIDIPPTFPPFLAVAELAESKNVWLDLHAEPVEPEGKSREAEVFGTVAMLYQKYPGLKLILSHTAMTNPANLRALFATYPSLMVNLKLVRDHDKWRNLEPICDSQGQVYEDWAVLMEAFPDRFMVGSDAKFGRKGFRLKKYHKEIKLIRKALGSLAPEAAEMIAWQNAVRVFGE